MLIRSFASILIVASSFVIVTAQAPNGQKMGTEAAKTSGAVGNKKLRDIPFPAGVDLQFVIKELARELDLNVLFDIESFRPSAGRKTFIDLKNVTVGAALDYIFLQEGLFFEEAGPKTILVASRFQGRSIPQIGVGVTPLTEQLAQYFGVDYRGILINTVRNDSPASRAGLKAGDVIVEMDGVAVVGGLGLSRALNDKNETDIVLTIVRDRKHKTINLTPQKGIVSLLGRGYTSRNSGWLPRLQIKPSST